MMVRKFGASVRHREPDEWLIPKSVRCLPLVLGFLSSWCDTLPGALETAPLTLPPYGPDEPKIGSPSRPRYTAPIDVFFLLTNSTSRSIDVKPVRFYAASLTLGGRRLIMATKKPAKKAVKKGKKRG